MNPLAERNASLGAFVHLAHVDPRGWAIAVKDNIDVAGMPSAAGIAARRGRIASSDAACVARLRAHGAVFVGKTLMDEAAFGALGDNPWFGRCHNPRRHGYTAGGSSAGSAAAVAAGLCAAALGTDTLGSVRIPASYCGVVGFVPGSGVLDMAGVFPLAPSLDRLGILAASVQAVAEVAAKMTDLVPAKVSGGRVGTLARLPEAARRLQAAGHRLSALHAALDWAALRRAALLLMEAEAARVLAPYLDDPGSSLSVPVRAALDFGRRADQERLARAAHEVAKAKARLAAWLEEADFLLLPATPQAAFPFDAPVPVSQADFTVPASIAGLPAISVPTETAADGLPIGAQIVGRHGDDARLLSLAACLA